MPLFSCYTRGAIRSVADQLSGRESPGLLKSCGGPAPCVCPCDVSQNWSGLEPWQWYRRCSNSGRALGALCPVRASKAVVASCHLPVRRQANAVPRLKRAMRLPFAYTDYRRACPAQLLPSARSSRHSHDGGRTVSSDAAFCLQPSTRRIAAIQG
jgi:hypothetical protein